MDERHIHHLKTDNESIRLRLHAKDTEIAALYQSICQLTKALEQKYEDIPQPRDNIEILCPNCNSLDIIANSKRLFNQKCQHICDRCDMLYTTKPKMECVFDVEKG